MYSFFNVSYNSIKWFKKLPTLTFISKKEDGKIKHFQIDFIASRLTVRKQLKEVLHTIPDGKQDLHKKMESARSDKYMHIYKRQFPCFLNLIF